MLSKVFQSLIINPVKQDWTEQVKGDLFEFKIWLIFDEIKQKSKKSFKKYVKIKALEFEFERLMIKKQTHSKMKDLNYTKLEMQTYLKLNNTNTEGARTLFKYRTRMAQYGENFRGNTGPVNCPLCGIQMDSRLWLSITVKCLRGILI